VIDPTTDRLLSLSQAARLLPPGRNDRPVHVATLTRWILVGVRTTNDQRVKLDAIRLGGRWLISTGALTRFAEALTADRAGAPPALPADSTTTARRRAEIDRANREAQALVG
jgi:hypothetical protein